MGLGESFREYVMGPRPLEARSLTEFVALGKANQVFYVDASAGLLRERHSWLSKKRSLIIPQVVYKGHTNPMRGINYVQAAEEVRLTEEDLATPEQKTRISLATLLTAHLSLQQIQKQIPRAAVKLYASRRPLDGNDIQQLLLDAQALGVIPFSIK